MVAKTTINAEVNFMVTVVDVKKIGPLCQVLIEMPQV